jgi:tRNA (adenine57-N1/adenine58-N1)-methyltransferase
MIKKILITKDNELIYIRDDSRDYHSHLGAIPKSELQKNSGIIKTQTGAELKIINPTMHDQLKKIKRGPAIMLPKDIGYIIAETGLGKKDSVLEAGTGSGALTITLANIAKKVYSYEINETHFKIAKENIEQLGIKNISLKNKDVKESNDDVDLIVLDLPQPWDYSEMIKNNLKNSGFIVTYLPTIVQVIKTVEEFNKIEEIKHMKTVEIIEREWHIEGQKVRPKSQMIAHTAFLSFFRKI